MKAQAANPHNTVHTLAEGDVPERIMWISPIFVARGYKMTDHNGQLDHPIRSCQGCAHLGIHDWHYHYCSMQYAENQRPNNPAPYPWRGAGALMQRTNAENCPIGERRRTGSSPPMPDNPTPEEERATEARIKAREIQQRLKRNLEKRRKK